MSDSLGRHWRSRFGLLLVGIFTGLVLPAFGQNSLPDKAAKAPFSQLKVKPASLFFAKVNFQKGPISSDKSLLVTNSGTEALSVTVGSSATAAFSVIAGAGPATLSAGQSETVTIEFAPAAAGSFSGEIAISSNATKGVADASLKLKGSAVGTIPLPPGISGNVSGGQSPITGASISLYAMSYTGYGSAPSQLAATTSDASGNFSFLSFTCPAGNPETYIVALGGDAGNGSNLAIGLTAVVGPCSSLSSPTAVTVNELSTVAAEWGLAQFSDPSGQNFGTSSTNATGLANAVGQITSDLVNSATGGPASFFPAAAHCSGGSPPANCDGLERMDTDANILAGCVESSGPASSACEALLNATGSGATTLQAAHVIAVNPAGDFNGLFALQSGSPPFTPALSTAPASWEIALNFTPSGAKFKNPNRVAIDAAGDIWILNYSGQSVTELSSNGGLIGNFAPKGANFDFPQGVAIEAAGNVWMTNLDGNSVTELTPSGGLAGNFAPSGADFDAPEFVAIDGAGNVWAANASGNSVTKLTSTGGLVGNFNNTNTSGANFDVPRGLAIDAAGNAWVTNESGDSVTELTSSGALVGNFAPSGANFDFPYNLAIDAAGNAWVTNCGTICSGIGSIGNSVTELTSGGGLAGNFAPVGANLVAPTGVAVDSAGNVWVTNHLSVTELTSSGSLVGSFAPSGANFNDPLGVAIDSAGNVWVPNYEGGSVAEIVSAAHPVLTPLVACLKQAPPHAVCLP